MVQQLWKKFGSILKGETHIPSNPPGYLPKKNETDVHTKTYVNVSSNIIYNS